MLVRVRYEVRISEDTPALSFGPHLRRYHPLTCKASAAGVHLRRHGVNSTPRRSMKQADSDTHAVLLLQFLWVIKGPGQEKETSHPWPHRVQQKPREYVKLINTFWHAKPWMIDHVIEEFNPIWRYSALRSLIDCVCFALIRRGSQPRPKRICGKWKQMTENKSYDPFHCFLWVILPTDYTWTEPSRHC